MNGRITLLTLLCLCTLTGFGQQSNQRSYTRGYIYSPSEVLANGDTIPVVEFTPTYIFSKKMSLRQYQRLIYNVKKVYPIAKTANRKLQEIEQILATMEKGSERDRYIKKVEKELKDEYTPVLWKMTRTQGKILVKLIDRETSHTSYELVKTLRGSFSAFLYQGIGKLFGIDLKNEYDKDQEDFMIERIIRLYEAGLI